jgi:glyoxylase-like metal-dependent hydrolase (beta-lactamase superfamily II)
VPPENVSSKSLVEEAGGNPFAPATPHYSWKLLRAGPLLLDGGSMFGVVPRVLWSKIHAPDEQGRIKLGHNCLLLERVADTINLNEDFNSRGPRRVIIEAGSGDKFDAKNRSIFGLTDECIATAVESTGMQCGQIDAAVVTHLHFDHCGGLTRGTGSAIHPTFPNAPVFVQRLEWEDALSNRSVMTRTYLRENLDPLRDHVKLIDAPPPFARGHRPAKAENPPAVLSDRRIEILPGISVFNVPGHTWGQQAVQFFDDRGRTVVFVPDLIPTRNHVGAAYNMAYDVEPYISTVTRRWFLQEAVNGNWLLILDHEPGDPVCRVREDGKGWFELVAEAK